MNIVLFIFLNLTIVFDTNYNINSNPFVGHWKAQWSMSQNNQFVLSSDKSSLMHGFFSFGPHVDDTIDVMNKVLCQILIN